MTRLRCCRGSSLVETILLVLVMFVPLLALLGALGRVHRAALGVTAAAREAAAAAVAAPGGDSAGAMALEAGATALRGHRLESDRGTISLAGLSSFARGAEIQARVGYPVRLVSIPFLSDAHGPVLWVRASHVARVDPYRSVP